MRSLHLLGYRPALAPEARACLPRQDARGFLLPSRSPEGDWQDSSPARPRDANRDQAAEGARGVLGSRLLHERRSHVSGYGVVLSSWLATIGSLKRPLPSSDTYPGHERRRLQEGRSQLMGVIAQTTESSPAVFVFLLIPVLTAFLPANIASKKGYSAGGFYLFGLFFFIPALIVALMIQDKRVRPPVVSAAITWTHTGFRYIMGYTVENNPRYGIWDRQQPGPPVSKYPYNEHGKAEVLERFRQLEPNGQMVATESSTPPPAPGIQSDSWVAGPR